VQTLTGARSTEVDRFFGCSLDINQPFKPDGVTPNNVLPATVPASGIDGPFTDAGNPPLPVQQAVLRFPHQCLVAEIAFDPIPIPVGKDPGNWDKLAQRNLAWSDLGSAQALCSFEVKASNAGQRLGTPPDELMIDWRRTPAEGTANVYLPALDTDEVVRLADQLYATHGLTRADAHTIACRTHGITYIPLTPGGIVDHAGLLSVELPDALRRGERFDVVVRQVTNASGRRRVPPSEPPAPELDLTQPEAAALRSTRTAKDEIHWRRVLGAFQLAIPVKTKEALLEPEERLLAVMRWINQAIPAHSRWYPVFARYLELLGGRVQSFGGDPTRIQPSPTGTVKHHRPHRHPQKPPEHRPGHELTGKVTGLTYDRFGDFDGFILDTDHDHRHRYTSGEPSLAALVERAWRERLRITVHSDPHHPGHPDTITIHTPPSR